MFKNVDDNWIVYLNMITKNTFEIELQQSFDVSKLIAKYKI